MVCAFAALLVLSVIVPAQWVKQEVATDASFRGLSVVNTKVVWASGTKGTFIRTTDGGAHWQVGTVPGAEVLDFRDVEAFDANTAYLMAAGPGEASRIYKTTDGGKAWTLQYQNKEPKAFFDSIAFWDRLHGMVLSDPVDGRFLLLRTDDGGKNWIPLPVKQRPSAIEGEAAFAASGTCLVTNGTNAVWIATGGSTARVLRSNDRGRSWKASETGIYSGASTRGNFSIAFSEKAKIGVVVGGDYQVPDHWEKNFAVSKDRGSMWDLIVRAVTVYPGGFSVDTTYRPTGFRSGVSYVPGSGGETFVTVGTNGSDVTHDGGKSWSKLTEGNFNSVAFANWENGWAVGPNGRVAKYAGLNRITVRNG
jgi:photosystem II stability/assembly factor-like uncharacterized protein